MYARDKMDSKETRLTPIPVDFVIEQGLNEHTEAKRRPYRTLITAGAEHEGMSEQGETIVSQLDTGKEIKRLKDLQDLPSTIAPKYRKGEKAEQLVMIIREINTRVENDENWNWALVMKVMLDEGLLMTNIPNKFDRLMLSMIPGKGVDTVRKSGDYSVIEERRSWHRWISNPNDDWKEAANRTVCEEIYAYFRPLLLTSSAS
jgi:hypothetical protein